MHSRAHLLIERDYEQLLADRMWGIKAYPVKDCSLFEWTAKILGPKDSLWEGGVFRVNLIFSEFYNDVPPEVYFHTIPFHPNVDPMTGRPALDILSDDKNWKPDQYGFGRILLAIQNMLSRPCLENVVNQEAANQFSNHPLKYYGIVHRCVVASQELEAKLCDEKIAKVKLPHVLHENEQNSSRSNGSERISVAQRTRLPFEDYLALWNNIGTSKSHSPPFAKSAGLKTPCNRYPVVTHNLEDFNQRRNSASRLRSSGKTNTDEPKKKEEIEKINRLKHLSSHVQTPTERVGAKFTIPRAANSADIDDLDHEAKSLLYWADNLDVNP